MRTSKALFYPYEVVNVRNVVLTPMIIFFSYTDVNGKRHTRKSRKGESKREFVRRCEVAEKSSSLTSGIAVTFAELYELWEQQHQDMFCSRGDKRSTRQSYDKYIHQAFGHLNLHEIKRADVYRLLTKCQKKGLASSTVAKIRGCISRPYNWAINTLGYDITCPTAGLRLRSVDRSSEDDDPSSEITVISSEDMTRFMEAAKATKYYNLFRVMQLTGLRPSEAIGLKVRDIKKDRLEIRQGITAYGLSRLKSKAASRDIPLSPALAAVLHAQRRQVGITSPWLFPSATGEPAFDAILSAFKRSRKQTAVWKRGGRNGLKKLELIQPAVNFSMYDFRHTFATRMAEAGMPLKTLQYIMGHSDISITMKYYVGITDAMLDQAAEIMEKAQ